MAGLKGKSGLPGNMNVFKHGLAAIQSIARRASKHLITLAALLWPTFQCSVDRSHNSRPEW